MDAKDYDELAEKMSKEAAIQVKVWQSDGNDPAMLKKILKDTFLREIERWTIENQPA